MNWWREQTEQENQELPINWKTILGGLIFALVFFSICAIGGMIQQELECRNGYQPSCVGYVVPEPED